MSQRRNYAQSILYSGLISGLCLGVPAGLIFWPVLLVRLLSPGARAGLTTESIEHYFRVLHPISVGVGALGWGVLLSRITHAAGPWRLALAGGLGVFGGTLLTFSFMRGDLLDQIAPNVPGRLGFPILLVGFVLIVITSTAVAFGIALRSWRIGRRLALSGGGAAALAIMLVASILSRLGIWVGNGNAGMVQVSVWGLLAAAVMGGAAMGGVLLDRAR